MNQAILADAQKLINLLNGDAETRAVLDKFNGQLTETDQKLAAQKTTAE